MTSCSKTNKLDDVNEILLFGDSLMSGYGLKKNQELSIILENDLKEAGYNIKVIMEVFLEILQKMDWIKLKIIPLVVILI